MSTDPWFYASKIREQNVVEACQRRILIFHALTALRRLRFPHHERVSAAGVGTSSID
jgi:hypothetical protein